MFIKRYGNPYEVERNLLFYFRKKRNQRNHQTRSKTNLN